MNSRVISIKKFKIIQAQIDLCASQNEDCDYCPRLKREACLKQWSIIVGKVPAKVGTYDFAESETIRPSKGNPLVECAGVSTPHGNRLLRPITILDVHGCPTGCNSALSLR